MRRLRHFLLSAALLSAAGLLRLAHHADEARALLPAAARDAAIAARHDPDIPADKAFDAAQAAAYGEVTNRAN